MQEAQGQSELSKLDDIAIPRQAQSPESLASANGVQNSTTLAVLPGPSQKRETTRWRYPGKRTLDLAMLVLVAIPALMIGLVSALAILLDDGGPVLFRQVRTGRDGRPFVLFKLRTMTNRRRRDDGYPEPSEITCTGRILRRTSIDELPQLLNVLRGDMSIVGPRPTLPQQVQRYDSRQFGRLQVQPGLTGLAQVNGRNQMTWSERIEWDLQYVEKQSLRLDLRVLAATARVVLNGDGATGHPLQDPIVRGGE